MRLYLVERNLPGVSRDQFEAAQQAILATLRTMSSKVAVRYLRGVFLPEQGRAFCLFEATDAQSVRDVNLEAGVAFESVNEAVELTVDGRAGTRS